MIPAASTTHHDLVEMLKAAPFYQVYQDAFRVATGLPLVIVSSDEPPFRRCHGSPNQNPFCQAINAGLESCGGCKAAQECVVMSAAERTQTRECFANLKESAVPIRLGGQTIGFLKTGQVLTEEPTKERCRRLADFLRQSDCGDEPIERLLELYRSTPVISEERYAGMMTILSAFALQLAAFMNRILLEARHSEPEPVRKAKLFIMEHIEEKLTLEEVAAEVHVSTFYLCKIFKQATGMTFTEFVNRQRVELAKRELLKANRRITEVAYDVGYQSLSQFNRSFLKIVGESPTQFRKNMLSPGNAQLVA